MKIYDIINEAPAMVNSPEYRWNYDQIFRNGNATSPAASTTAASTNTSNWSSGQRAYRRAARDPEAGSSWIRKAYKKFGQNQQRTDRIIAARKEIWGKYFTFLYLIGVTVGAYELYSELDFAESQIGKANPETGEVFTKEDYKDLEELLWGIFTVQVLTPVIVRIVRTVFLINWVLRIIKWVAGGISVGVTAGVSLALLVASEAFQIWFQVWIGTESGKKWLLEHGLLPIIKTGGVPAAFLSNLYKEWRGSDAAKDADKTSGASGQTSGNKQEKPDDINKTDKAPANTAPKVDLSKLPKIDTKDLPNVTVSRNPTTGELSVEMK